MRTKINGQVYDEERALYHLIGTDVEYCTFAGPADGESALKEARDITVSDCQFSLRYPLWHTEKFSLVRTSMDEFTRAPIWYAKEGVVKDCTIHGIKCLRECQLIRLEHCTIQSPEFGWKCSELTIVDSEIESEYFLLDSHDLQLDGLKLKGKYSFQYVENVEIKNSILDTKDAFWHCSHVTVRDSVIRGEYAAWFSNDLTLINCKISGTQPFCYCKNLTLINCTMEGTDLSFEYSDVSADITGSILSVKNPKSGIIRADEIGELILEDSIMETSAKIEIRTLMK